ncbi:MAG: NAD(+) synthase [Myxococcales bacterium]|nr:NAD(+) synthase [Myxococcales bacterium]MCB9649841.1 NAD(+) synthase [Deltaproteobacteria bacterium]
MTRPALTPAVLDFDAAQVTERLVTQLRHEVVETLGKRGVSLGVSGGIDSATVLMLAVRAMGPENVVALAMPERESSDESLSLARELCKVAGTELVVEDITTTLEAAGCYRRRDEAIRELVPEFGAGWRCKLALGNTAGYQITYVVVQAPGGEPRKVRPTARAYNTIVAASNFKQRTRKMMEYFHADRMGFAVAGTPNLLEYDQGFFVKGGDGLADVKPICKLYKTQVYRLAAHLGVPQSILSRPPTTDTFSMPQSQEEFYFTLPYPQMDLCLYALDHGYTAEETAPAVELPVERVQRTFDFIQRKRVATKHLHLPPIPIEPG